MDENDFDDEDLFGINDDLTIDNNENTSPVGNFRDGTLFLVDCSENMFTVERKCDSDEPEMSPFQKCMKAIRNMYQQKIYGSDRDFLAILFFATNKNNTNDEVEFIYELQDLDQPNAERIKQIEEFVNQDYNSKMFKRDYGHSESFLMDKVLWWSSNMFSKVTQKLDTKRIILFTCNSHPHRNDKSLEKFAKNKAKDLYDIGINLEVIPIVNNNKENKFDYREFYGDMMMLSEEQLQTIPDADENFEELERTVRSKDHKRRPYTHLNLKLSDECSISCSVFNLIRKCPKPTKIKLDKKTNVETKSVTRRFIPDTGEILFNSDTKLACDILDKRVTFELEEVKAIKRFSKPGLKLLGFKSLNSIKPSQFVKQGHFLYPNEKEIEGSTTLFNALLQKCLEKKRFILCELIARAGSPPKLIALCPQQQETDENNFQVSPPGFHAIYLPFADDFRSNDRSLTQNFDIKNVEIFKKCIQKLKFNYDPEDFKDPAIQKLWFEIEAIALDRKQAENFVDLTIPNNERIEKRVGEYLKLFADNIGLKEVTKIKRKVFISL
jgi:ATP-dependent DNA helicase 2 subunit 1